LRGVAQLLRQIMFKVRDQILKFSN